MVKTNLPKSLLRPSASKMPLRIPPRPIPLRMLPRRVSTPLRTSPTPEIICMSGSIGRAGRRCVSGHTVSERKGDGELRTGEHLEHGT